MNRSNFIKSVTGLLVTLPFVSFGKSESERNHQATIDYLKKYPQIGIYYFKYPMPKNVTILIDLGRLRNIPEHTPDTIIKRLMKTGEFLFNKNYNDTITIEMMPYNP